MKVCNYCEKTFEPSHVLEKYCSTLCRSRMGQRRHGNEAKEIKCARCKEPFKRRSAKNTKCILCRNLERMGIKAEPKKDELISRPNTKRENDMIKQFLKGRKHENKSVRV